MQYAAKADDSHQMSKLRVLDLFSGIGGFSLGLERTGGFETVAFCEIEPFPRKVLAKHWPEVPIYEDVRTLTGDTLARDGIAVDVITGGFPCQDLSVAGKQAGLGEGTRSGLWSEIVRLIGDLSPRYVIVENVANLLSGPSGKRGGWFGRVLGDLAECGYDAEWENIPASALGAPHRRERVWIVAHPKSERSCSGKASRDSESATRHKKWDCQKRAIKFGTSWHGDDVAHAPKVQRNGGDDHARKRMGRWPLSQLGNDGWEVSLADANAPRLEGGAETGNLGGVWSGGEQFFERCANLPRTTWSVEPAVGRVANGIPNRVDRLAGLGNAVVPQIPELIGRAILEVEGQNEIRRQS